MDFLVSDKYAIDLSQYEILERYIETKNATFYRVAHKETGEKFLAKIGKDDDYDDIYKSDTPDFFVMKNFMREIDILSQLDSPFIIKFKGFSLVDFKEKSNPTLILDNAPNGTLRNLLKSSYVKITKWNEIRKLMIIYGIAAGMLYIHSKGLIHRDLTPENIFLNEYLIPKIANFDFSIIDSELGQTISIGNIQYVAPEVLKEEDYDNSIDVYSFGLIMHEIISGNFLKMPLTNKLGGIKPKLDSNIPPAYADLINSCLEFDPKKRPKFDEIVSLLKTSNDFITDEIDKKYFMEYVELFDSDEFNHSMNKKDEDTEKHHDHGMIDSISADEYNESNDSNNENEINVSINFSDYRQDKDMAGSSSNEEINGASDIVDDDEINAKIKKTDDDDKNDDDKNDDDKNDDDKNDDNKNDDDKNDDNKNDDDKNDEDKIEKTKFIFEEIHIDYPQKNELLIKVDPINLNLFTKEKSIGQGQFDEVFRIKKNKTEKIYAAKISKLLLKELDEIQFISLSREITILSKLKYPSIMKFIGYNSRDFINIQKPTIITEFINNNSLRAILDLQIQGIQPNGWNETKVLINIYGIASGMAYLHSKDIIHRDLKPDNIFIDEFLYPKIGDFGLSKEIDDKSTSYFDSTNYIGTPQFMAPEIFDQYIYSKAADVHAFGITVYQMVTLEEPFKDYYFYKLIQDVATGIRPKIDPNVPIYFQQLIEKCWSNNADERPTFDDIVYLLENNNEFITINIDENEYLDYIQYIKDNKIKKTFHPVTIDFEELKKLQKENPSLNVSYLDLKQYEILNLIKRIANFKIYDIKNKETNIIYEAKISNYSITDLSKNDAIHLSREINILSKIDHPSFLKFIGYSPIDFDQQPMPVIVTEKPPNKSLKDLLKYERNEEHIEEWDDTKKLIVIYGISAGMSYLHSNNILHRNLTPESIFLDKFLFPKIGNFGLLSKIHSIKTMTFQTTVGVKGDIIYSSPELLECYEYSKSSDVYAFSLIVYEIMTNEKPFKNIDNLKDLKNEIVINKSRPKFNEKIKEHYQKLISLCWSQNPQDRPTFSNIMSVLKNDSNFLNDINIEIFNKYVEFIEKSNIEFYSKNQIVKFDDLIEKKNADDQFYYNIDDEDYDIDDESKEKAELSHSNESIVNKSETSELDDFKSRNTKISNKQKHKHSKKHDDKVNETDSDSLKIKEDENNSNEEDSDSLKIKEDENKSNEEDSDSLLIKEDENNSNEEDSDSLKIKEDENKINEEDSDSLLIKEEENKSNEEDLDPLLIKEDENNSNEEDSDSLLMKEDENKSNKKDSDSILMKEEETQNNEEDSDSLLMKEEENKRNEEDSDSLLMKEEENKRNEEDSDSLLLKEDESKSNEEDSDSILIKEDENNSNEEDSDSLLMKEDENKSNKKDSDSLLMKEEENSGKNEDYEIEISHKRKSGKSQHLSKKHFKNKSKKKEDEKNQNKLNKKESKLSLIENDSIVKKYQEDKSKTQNKSNMDEFEENDNLNKENKKNERKGNYKKTTYIENNQNNSSYGSINKQKLPNKKELKQPKKSELKHKKIRLMETNLNYSNQEKNNSDDNNTKKYKLTKKKTFEPGLKNQHNNEPIINKHKKRKSDSKIKEKFSEYSDNEDNYKKSNKQQQKTTKLYSTKNQKESIINSKKEKNHKKSNKINEYNNRNEDRTRKHSKNKPINRSKSVNFSRSIKDKMRDKFDLSYSEESVTINDSNDNLYQNNQINIKKHHHINNKSDKKRTTKRNNYEFSTNKHNRKLIGKKFKIEPMENLFYNSENEEEDENEVEEESSSDDQLDLISRKKRINWDYIIDPLQPKLSKQKMIKIEKQFSIDRFFQKIVSTKK